MSNLKSETLHGVKWSAVNGFANKAISFAFGIVLARLLAPSDFGVLGMIAIFFAIASIFIDSGFGTALVQKKNVTDEDMSTMFYFNGGMALFFYIILFFSSPWIADFLDTPILKDIIRVSGLSMVIGALGGVQYNMLTRKVDFKTPAIISMIANVSSGCVGVFLAYSGYGPWALVSQGLLSTIISVCCVWVHSKWRPLLKFSVASFKDMASFGGNLTINAILDKIYNEGTGFLIGKFYKPAQLGYYTKGQSTATLPSTFLSDVVSGVLLPVLSKIQDDDEALLKAYRRFMRIMSLSIFFGIMLLVALARPLTIFLYSDKWIPAIIFVQIFCMRYMFYHIHRVNWDLLLVKKRTDLCLKKEMVNKIWDFGFLAIAIPFGVQAIAWAGVLASIFNIFVNTYVTGKVFPYGFKSQFMDFMPYLLKAAIVCTPAYLLASSDILSPLLTLIVGSVGSILIYGFYLYLSKDENFITLVELTPLKKYIHNK